jgi:hypothetical protein
MKQRKTQRAFEYLDLIADGGLTAPDFFRRSFEVPGFGNHDKAAQS